MADELSLNAYGRAANDAIARWKSEMAKSGKELEGVSQDITKLRKKKALTAEEAKQLKESTRLRDGIREAMIAKSKQLDGRLQSFKLMKDTDVGAYGKVQGKLGSLIKEGLPLTDHFSITLKPMKLNGGLFILKGKIPRLP